ncbi:MAG: SDR family oxidoreductase [Vicinamibacterales bacterium]
MTTKPLAGKVAVVAGASRGCGRGVALALGDAGATVYVTGRTTRGGPAPVDGATGTIDDTADEVTRRGGTGLPIPTDHTDQASVAALVNRVQRDHGRLDLLVSAVWGGNERFLDPIWQRPFWEQPATSWREFMEAGPLAFWLTAREAGRLMAERRSGLMVAISEPVIPHAFDDQMPAMVETFSSLAHASMNGLVRALAGSAKAHGIGVVGLLPGFMKTERVEMHLTSLGEEARRQFRYDLAETPEYAGRAVAALAADPRASSRTGELLHVSDLAGTYGFTDVDGTRVGNFYRTLGLIP